MCKNKGKYLKIFFRFKKVKVNFCVIYKQVFLFGSYSDGYDFLGLFIVRSDLYIYYIGSDLLCGI